MKDMPDGAVAEMPQLPDVIYLPDHSRRSRKKITSGSNNRRRQHLEWFRTDDTEHAALHALLNGESLGAFVMRLAGIDGGNESRVRRRGQPAADALALTQAMVEFSRQHNNYNQAVKAMNTLALVADDRGDRQMTDEIRRLIDVIEALQMQFVAPVAAIQAALGHVREG